MTPTPVRIVELELLRQWARDHVREEGGNNRGPFVQMLQRADALPGEVYAWCQCTLNGAHRLATGGRIVNGDIVGGEMLLGGVASVGFAVARARELGLIVGRPEAGDNFAMNLDTNSWPDHTGKIERVLGRTSTGAWICDTIEGNTGSGSVADGDGIYPRRRILDSRTVFYRVPGIAPRGALPPAILVKRTGYFAWLAWYEGLEDWKPYGPRRGVVRPDVPVKVAALWWARRKVFLARRRLTGKEGS